MIKNPFRELDHRNRKNSSDLLKRPTDYNKVINQRSFHLLIILICVFLVIALRLIQIQVIENDDYTMKLEAYTRKQQVVTPPRGEIFDRFGNLLVGNNECLNITYYPPSDVANYSEQKWRLAYEFAKHFKISEDSVSEREWKDFYLIIDDSYGNSLLTEQELKQAFSNELSNAAVYDLKIKRINDKFINELMSQPLSERFKEAGYLSNLEKKQAWPVMMLMERATVQEASVVVENASVEDVAYLIEHKEQFPGFDVSADWTRSYPYGSTIRDILGSVSTRGLDKSSQDYYLANGYALNERVGSSGLELEYEKYLKGTRTVNDISYDEESGIAILSPSSTGKKGYDLKLTIDIELQQKIDQILIDVMEKEKDNEYRKNFNQAFVSLMNPQNGEIIAMSGQQRLENGEYIPYASGNYLQNNNPGSVVKLATMYLGLNEEVVQPGEIIVDAPMHFAGNFTIASATNKGKINDIQAIAQSSNIYMFHIALRLGGGVYQAGAPLYIPDLDAYETFRKYYAMFGLGVSTGLDVPYEEVGYLGPNREAGKLLNLAIGQYDTYTPIQLLQYVSTVGNNGIKVRPHFLKEVYEINSDESIIYQHGTQVLSTVSGNTEYFNRIKEGMRECVNTGFCGGWARALDKDIAAKTGTAELHQPGGALKTTSSIIGFAPSEEPEVAFVCVAPDSNNDKQQTNICFSIMDQVMKEYYHKYQ